MYRPAKHYIKISDWWLNLASIFLSRHPYLTHVIQDLLLHDYIQEYQLFDEPYQDLSLPPG